MRVDDLLVFPVVAMRGVVLFPDTVNHFDVSRDASIKSVNYCLDRGERIFLVCQKDISVEYPKEKEKFVDWCLKEYNLKKRLQVCASIFNTIKKIHITGLLFSDISINT